MRLEGSNVESYINRLNDEDKEPFRTAYETYKEDISDTEIKSTINRRLHRRRKHVDLVVAVVSGFSTETDSVGDDSRFIFHSTDPLRYISPSGADVLLARRERRRIHLCAVICEVGDERIDEWNENVNSSYQLFADEENLERISEQLGFPDRTISEVQHILLKKFKGVPKSDIADQISPEKFAIWSAETTEESKICHEHGERIHRDLREIAEDCFDWAFSGENPIKYTLNTHELIPLEEVIFGLIRAKKTIRNDPEPLEFNKDEFRDRYGKHLQIGHEDEQKESLVREATAGIFELAEQIGIFSSTDTNTVRDYRVMFSGSSEDPFDAQNSAEEKYINVAKEVRRTTLAHQRAGAEFDSLQHGLDEWVPDQPDGTRSGVE